MVEYHYHGARDVLFRMCFSFIFLYILTVHEPNEVHIILMRQKLKLRYEILRFSEN